MSYGTGKYRYDLVDGWAKLPEGSFSDVTHLAIDSLDNVYMLRRSGNPLMVFDRDGNLLTSWGEGFFKRAHGICVSPDGSVYFTDDGNHTVSKFTAEGKLLLTLGKKDQPSETGYLQNIQKSGYSDSIASIRQGGPPFNRPTGIALSSSGEIYVSDGYGNARIHKFTPDGTLLFSWGEPGSAPGQFRVPHSVWVDKKDRVWVCDRENNRIQIFNSQGKFLSQWTDVNRPSDIFIDNEGIVYISEISREVGTRRGVSIFSNDGKLLARWGSQEEFNESSLFLAPHTIAVDSRGDLYVGEVPLSMFRIDKGSKSIQKFARMTPLNIPLALL